MKLSTMIVLMLSFVSVGGALACPSRQKNLFCPEDFVISSNGLTGSVMAVHPSSHTVTVHWTEDSEGFSHDSKSTNKIKHISIGLGCVSGFCVKDDVISEKGWTGTIIGVNPFTKEVAVNWRSNANGLSHSSKDTRDIDRLAIGLGCVSGFCVGDGVVGKNGWAGTVIGVNHFNQNASVHWKENEHGSIHNSRSSHEISTLLNVKQTSDYHKDYRASLNNQFIFDRLEHLTKVFTFSFEFWYDQQSKSKWKKFWDSL